MRNFTIEVEDGRKQEKERKIKNYKQPKEIKIQTMINTFVVILVF